METTEGTPKNRSPLSGRSLEVVIPIIGLVYSALLFLYYLIVFSFTPGGPPDFIVILIPFLVLFLASAFGVWRRSRPGYIAAVASSVLLLLLEGSGAAEGLVETANTIRFVGSITVLPTVVATLIYSAQGLRTVWTKTPRSLPTRTIPRSSIIGLFVLGFILGGLLIGLLAGTTQARLLAIPTGNVDITIPNGASSPANSEFYAPKAFTAKAGQTVTWINRDPSAHTVTSTTNLFDSGMFPSGGLWSHAFAQAGTYEYYCTLHTWMKGTVIVQSG